MTAYLTDGSESEPIALEYTDFAEKAIFAKGAELVITGCRSTPTPQTEGASEGKRPPLKWHLELKPESTVMTVADAEAKQLLPASFDHSWGGKPVFKKQAPAFIAINTLNPDSKAKNIIARVLQVEKTVRPTAAGSKITAASALVGDATASIKLIARSPAYRDEPAGADASINALQTGKTFVFFNVHVEMQVQPTNPDVGTMELVADKWSTIRSLEDLDKALLPEDPEVKTVNEGVNMSAVEFTQKEEEDPKPRRGK